MNAKQQVGLLLIFILVSGAVYVTLSNQAKFRVDEDKSTFYVLENSRWVVSGREYVSLWDGSTKINRRASQINIETTIGNITEQVIIQRTTPYIRGPVIVDTWEFDAGDNNIEHFPYVHTVRVLNASGYIFQYEVRDLQYDGDTRKNVESPQEFGRNMKVEWQEGSYWNTVYKSGIIKIRYRPGSDDETYLVRLYDPPKSFFKPEEICEITQHNSTRNIPVYENSTTVFPNGTVEIKTYVIGNTEEIVFWNTSVCKQSFKIRGKRFVPVDQGYACTIQKNWLECDSTIYDNGDGICSPNGGENCCRVFMNGKIECKNSVVDWKDTNIIGKRLKV